MNRHEIRLLQQIKGHPAVTITLPTHRTSPANRQDPIRLKNLIEQTVSRLQQQYSKRELDPLLAQLEKLVASIDWVYTLDGLALFVSHDFARAVHLPFALPERVVVDESFLTRDLVYAANRTPRYWVLALSEKPTRLFEGVRESLVEIQEGGFPMAHEGQGGAQPLPGGLGVEPSAIRDDRHRQFFRQVDAALKPFMAEDPLPLVVVGVDRLLAFFHEMTNHKNAIVTTLTGSHDKTSAHELGKLVWPLVKANLDQDRQQVLAELERAIGEQKYVSTVGEAWRLAHEGRGKLLLVEEDFHYPARVDETGRHISPANDPAAPDVIDDAVDEIIEMVLNKQGRVVFVDHGQLTQHGRIALALRY